MATKKYKGIRIMFLEDSVQYKNEGFTVTKDGRPDSNAFRGILDESLDALKHAEVYESYGNHHILNGYRVTDENMTDHVRIVNRRPVPSTPTCRTGSLITISSM